MRPARKASTSTDHGVGLLGPDAQDEIQVKLHNDERAKAGLDLEFFASELRLRGDQPIVQPHVSPERDVLCWNGEVCLDVSLIGRLSLNSLSHSDL